MITEIESQTEKPKMVEPFIQVTILQFIRVRIYLLLPVLDIVTTILTLYWIYSNKSKAGWETQAPRPEVSCYIVALRLCLHDP
jgi:hypothetical protein